MTGVTWKNTTASALQKAEIFSLKHCSLLNTTALQVAMGPPGLEVARAQILPHHDPRTQDIVLGACALCSDIPQVPPWKAVSVLIRLVRRRNFFNVNSHIHYRQYRNNLVLFSWK